MAQQKNTKLKLLYLSDILSEKTDEAHPLSANELCDALCAAGIEAERKSVYKDIEVLKEYGLDIILGTENNKRGYFIGARKFELAELRLLLDAKLCVDGVVERRNCVIKLFVFALRAVIDIYLSVKRCRLIFACKAFNFFNKNFCFLLRNEVRRLNRVKKKS